MGAGRRRRGRPRARASGELGGRRRNGNFVVVVVAVIKRRITTTTLKKCRRTHRCEAALSCETGMRPTLLSGLAAVACGV